MTAIVVDEGEWETVLYIQLDSDRFLPRPKQKAASGLCSQHFHFGILLGKL